MLHTLDQIRRDVRTLLRENPVAPALAIGCTQLTLDQWIDSQLPAAVEAEHLLADAAAFDAPLSFTGAISWHRPDIGAGRLPLPTDFLRLVAFKMSDWAAPVSTAIGIHSPLYPRQLSPHPGVRGNPSRPVCAIVPAPTGPMLEFYACRDTSATIQQALYIPRPVLTPDAAIDIAPACYLPVIDRLAASFRQ